MRSVRRGLLLGLLAGMLLGCAGAPAWDLRPQLGLVTATTTQTGLTFQSATPLADGGWLVTTSSPGQIQHYAPDGSLTQTIAVPQTGHPTQVAVWPDHPDLLCETGGRIHWIDSETSTATGTLATTQQVILHRFASKRIPSQGVRCAYGKLENKVVLFVSNYIELPHAGALEIRATLCAYRVDDLPTDTALHCWDVPPYIQSVVWHDEQLILVGNTRGAAGWALHGWSPEWGQVLWTQEYAADTELEGWVPATATHPEIFLTGEGHWVTP